MDTLHDFNIYAYEVQASERRIVLHARYDFEPKQEAKAIFEGVVGHHFENALEGNIVLSLEEVSNDAAFYAQNERELRTYGSFGFPVNVDTVTEFVSDLKQKGLHLYELYSSYGMTGWVCATCCSATASNKQKV